MPNDYPLAIGGIDHGLFSLWQADRPWDCAPALRKILKPPLHHVKQRNEPAVENDRADLLEVADSRQHISRENRLAHLGRSA